MTTDELFQPRYKVIAIYPFNNHFMLNEIITLNEFDNREHLTKEMNEAYVLQLPLNPISDVLPITMYESTFQQYPHLFKKLEWWEDRKVEEMPEYVTNGEAFLKVVKHFDSPIFFLMYGGVRVLYRNWKPATEVEYNEYNKSHTK